MRRALIWLNLYGREAIQYKLKNGSKTPKRHFSPVLGLMSDSLTAIYVEPYQCPLHQSILPTQGPIHEIFMKKYSELAELENEVFLSRPFWFFFFKKNFFFAFFQWKLVRVYWLARMGWNFANYPGSQPKITPPKHFSRQWIYNSHNGNGLPSMFTS